MSSQEACKFSSSYTLLGRGKSWKYFYFAFEKTGRKEKFATRIYRESASEIGEKKNGFLTLGPQPIASLKIYENDHY